MAHTVCGIDLGTYSVKLALLEAGFRATTLRGLDEIAVPPGEAPLIERQLQAVREALSQLGSEVTPYLAIPGDQLSVREAGWRHELAKLVQFCACRKPTRIIWRIGKIRR